MKNIIPKLVLIGLIVGVCLWSVYPPQKKIRLGKDLQGGVSLVYSVKIAEGSEPDQVLAQTIDVLKQRVNPQGILDIGMQPVGRDRIEVVMPLPNDQVRALQQTYRDALDALLAVSRIRPSQLDAALDAGNASAKYGGTSLRKAELDRLQAAWVQAKAARADLVEAEAGDPVDEIRVDGLRDRIARAEITVEELQNTILSQSFGDDRLFNILALEGAPRLRDAVLRRAAGRRRRLRLPALRTTIVPTPHSRSPAKPLQLLRLPCLPQTHHLFRTQFVTLFYQYKSTRPA